MLRGRRATTFLAIVLLVSGPAVATTPPAAAAPDDTVAVSRVTALESPILIAVNRIRRTRGLRPLASSPALARAASAHVRALAIAGQFRHEWPDGRRFDLWMRRYYPSTSTGFWGVGETLIWNSAGLTAEGVARSWLRSAPHRRVLLTPYWRQLGVGVVHAESAGGVYGSADVTIAAAEFGARS